jgi:23S rRNA-/tRNA-specific pseudouridylate synthase
MRKIPDVAKAELVSPDASDGRQAILSMKRLKTKSENGEISSLVQILLETGRMHQIRLQFGSRGFPVLGDVLYGSQRPWGDPNHGYREPPIALHAESITFAHPKTAERMTYKAPPPGHWDGLARSSHDPDASKTST